MGRKDGENAVPTVIGTAKTSVNAHPITAKRTGSSRARSNTAASIAPATAYVNATASMDTFVHAAKVGRERGRESPIPVSPAMATLAGRSAASIKLCTPGSGMAAPKAVPNIPYWTSRDASAPAIAPTRTKTRAPMTALPTTARATTPEPRCRWPPARLPARPRGRLPTAPQGGTVGGREEPSHTRTPARRQR